MRVNPILPRVHTKVSEKGKAGKAINPLVPMLLQKATMDVLAEMQRTGQSALTTTSLDVPKHLPEDHAQRDDTFVFVGVASKFMLFEMPMEVTYPSSLLND